MTHLPRPLMRPWVWLWRFRHRCGYGIHSPYAFKLVTEVVYDRRPRPAYAPLVALRSPHARRDDRLCLRLAERYAPQCGLVVGPDTDITMRYLQAGHPPCRYLQAATAAQALAKAQELGRIDLLYVDLPRGASLAAQLTDRAGEQTLFVVAGIHRTRADLSAWRQLISQERCRVSFDLYWMGLAVFESRLNKQDYIINF